MLAASIRRASSQVKRSALGGFRALSTESSFTVTLPEGTYETYQLDAPDANVELSKEKLIQMYKDMVTVRRLEMAADALYKSKKIRGFCHLSNGQEAVAVGMEHAIDRDDSVITSYRCHGFAYMRGASIKAVLGELLGKRCGVSYGKGGSMHMFTHGFYGGTGIVGAQVPVGAGLAFAHKYSGQTDKANFALYGDGASNQGQIFESYNMAKLWNLPCVFICENNKYGMGTSAGRSSALTKYYQRGQFIPGLKVNGMDVVAVYQASKFAKAWTTAGNGPLVIEFETYRYGGHSMSDPGTTYRTREEIQHMRSSNDPIAGLKTRLINFGISTEAELKQIDKEIRRVVDKEAAEADASAPPEADPKILFEDVYVPGTEIPVLRGRIPEENWSFAKQ
ncbi:hypothetical protein NADFUDRAFT_82632 [Nadsonia fulvescens var. elongata DSM 6958]|uniref:Pyruvate dehydrogenase E1 component subunit alpha n=2 Tax=Nadsonia fulvescens TaxID=45786 RepID=A0A1E3PL97_9ASCO|nr:hypothetical protein NADFUDRAFT_82632 [Nadsonia fulvescens var. elongata DSM 6958]